MYQKELKFLIVKYNKNDLDYIDKTLNEINVLSKDIVSFFNIKDFGQKIVVEFWDDLDKFRLYFSKQHIDLFPLKEDVPNWVCGFALNDFEIHLLSFDLYKKTKGHENDILKDFIGLIAHEFVHSCHMKINSNATYKWLSEGLATTISHQYDGVKKKFDLSLEEVMNGGENYTNYYTFFSYVLDNYGKDYILHLINDFEFLKKETPRLYNEIKKVY